MLDRLLQAQTRVVGAKQVLSGLRAGSLQCVYVAIDADPFVTRRIIDAAEKARIPLYETDSMAELGSVCGIQVGAAAAAVARDPANHRL
jgi:large subunit ribosomal protein L7A